MEGDTTTVTGPDVTSGDNTDDETNATKPNQEPRNDGGSFLGVIVGVVLGVVAALALLVVIVLVAVKAGRKKVSKLGPTQSEINIQNAAYEMGRLVHNAISILINKCVQYFVLL